MPRYSRRALLAGLAAATAAGCTAAPGDPTGADTDGRTTDPSSTTSTTEAFPPPSPTPGEPDSPLPLPTDTEWRQRGHTPDRRGRLDGAAVPADPEPAWSFYTPMSAPVVADGTLYAVEEGLAARDAATGRLEWRVDVGGEAAATPAVGDGRLYVQRYTAMEAYDPDGGGRLWRTAFGGGSPSSPAVVDRVAYAAQGELQTPAAVAAFGPDGTRRWLVELDGEVRGPPAVVDDIVEVVAADGTVHGVGIDGDPRWTADVAAGTESGPAGADGVVYVHDADGVTHALEAADGSEVWTAADGPEAERGTAPALAADAVVVPGAGGAVCRERSDGAERWRVSADGAATTPSVDDEAVYLGESGSSGRIRGLDLADGSERWGRRTEEQAVSDMIVAGIDGPPTLVAGGLYVVAADGVRAFRRGEGTA